MLMIRLSRVGRSKQPSFRLIVSEKQKDPWGNYLELLGNYNPRTKEANFKSERIKYWISNGAQPSPSVNNLLIKEGVIEGKKQKSVKISNRRKAKMEGKKTEAAAASAKQAEAAKAKPAEEAKPEAEVKEETPASETVKETEVKTEEPAKPEEIKE